MTKEDLKTPADYSTGLSPSTSDQDSHLAARVEALLFAAPGPVEASKLASSLGVGRTKVDEALEWLEASYAGRGLSLQRSRHGVQLTTSPDHAGDVERFLELESTSRLTRAALEVLAVVAYQQPVTRPQIDDVRGVNSESALRTLMRHGLIEEVGRTEAPGRPILYATTHTFLEYFGLRSLDELPPVSPEGGVEALDEVWPAESEE